MEAKEKKTLWFRAVLVPEKGGGYSAYCPSLPGVISGGNSEEEALNNLQEAVSLHLEVLCEEGRPLLQGDAFPKPGILASFLRWLLPRRPQRIPVNVPAS